MMLNNKTKNICGEINSLTSHTVFDHGYHIIPQINWTTDVSTESLLAAGCALHKMEVDLQN